MKTLIAILCLLIALTFVGCQSTEQIEAENQPESKTSNSEIEEILESTATEISPKDEETNMGNEIKTEKSSASEQLEQSTNTESNESSSPNNSTAQEPAQPQQETESQTENNTQDQNQEANSEQNTNVIQITCYLDGRGNTSTQTITDDTQIQEINRLFTGLIESDIVLFPNNGGRYFIIKITNNGTTNAYRLARDCDDNNNYYCKNSATDASSSTGWLLLPNSSTYRYFASLFGF